MKVFISDLVFFQYVIRCPITVVFSQIVIIQSSEGSSQRHKTLDPKTVQFTFTDLFPNTRYTVKIAADSKQGVGEYSTVTAQTLSNGTLFFCLCEMLDYCYSDIIYVLSVNFVKVFLYFYPIPYMRY